MNIVEIASETARKEKALSVSQIELEIGQLAGVLVDSLQFCFEAAARNTPVEGSRLNIISVPAQGRCPSCDKQFPVDSLFTPCPRCGSYGVQLVAGDQLKIKSVIIMEGVPHV